MARELTESRIVEMKFKNEDFERKAKESKKTLDDLNEKLKFKGAAEGAKNVNVAIDGIDTSKLSKAIDTINYRFSTM